jgi:hypothetical protein
MRVNGAAISQEIFSSLQTAFLCVHRAREAL